MLDLDATFASRAGGVRDLDDLTRRFQLFLGDFGIDDFGYAPIDAAGRPVRAESATTWSREFLDFFYGNGLIDLDPTFALALGRARPFLWSGLLGSGVIDRRAAQAMGMAGEMGLADGITISIPGPRGCAAVLDLTVRRPGPALKEAMRHRLTELYLGGLEFHTLCRGLLTGEVGAAAAPAPPASEIVLTLRERQCWLWLARGKTTSQVSEKLQITERTVLFHCANVRRKLKASSRGHALAMLMREGLIHP